MKVHLLNRVKNIVVKGETALNEQSLFFPLLFLKIICCRCKYTFQWKRVDYIHYPNDKTRGPWCGPGSITWIMQCDWDAYHNNMPISNLVEGNQRNISAKLFGIWPDIFGEEYFKRFRYNHIRKTTPPQGGPVFQPINMAWKNMIEGHQRNIFTK